MCTYVPSQIQRKSGFFRFFLQKKEIKSGVDVFVWRIGRVSEN
jgi:hypothetical protein